MNIYRIGIVLTLTIAFTAAVATSQTKPPIDSVVIGNLMWTKQNLNIETPNSWCFGGDKSNCAKYGRLYTYTAAKDVCKNIGVNWRLPTREDWSGLVNHAGGEKVAGKKLRSKSGWEGNSSGTDDYGFSALGGGYRSSNHGGGSGNTTDGFLFAGYYGRFWSALEVGGLGGNAYFWNVYYNFDYANELAENKTYGFSVRCASEVAQSKTAPIDSVAIGNLKWTKQNIGILTADSWCYENNNENCAKYGRLYTWEAANKACGSMGGKWRLPTSAEWDSLIALAGGKDVAGKKLKAKSGWDRGKGGAGGSGTDDYGFSGLPGGYRNDRGHFGNAGRYGNWWGATPLSTGHGRFYRDMNNNDGKVGTLTPSDKYGFSARCVSPP